MGKRCVIWAQFLLGTALPCFLQFWGTFTPYWVFEDGFYKGLFYQVLSDGQGSRSVSVLDQATLGLQTTCFILMLIITINCVITNVCYGPDKYGDIDNPWSACLRCCGCCFYCGIALYVTTGILSLAGCGRFGTVFHLEQISVSFYACLTASLILWLNIFVFICDQLCKRRGHDNVFSTLLCEVYEEFLP